MKSLERIFFIACINNCNGFSYKSRLPVRYVVQIFALLGFPRKQLVYYLKKWSRKGFYDYGVNIELGWFEIDKLNSEYKTIYCDRISFPNNQWLSDNEFKVLAESIKNII